MPALSNIDFQLNKKVIYSLFVFGVIIVVYGFGLSRYLMYGALLIPIFASGKIKRSVVLSLIMSCLLFSVHFLLVGRSEFAYFFVRDFLLILIPLVSVMTVKTGIESNFRSGKYISRALIILGVFVFAKNIGELNSFDIVQNFVSSESNLETHSAPLYAIGGIMALVSKRKKAFIALSILCILASKRIVTAGYILIVMLYLIQVHHVLRKKFPKFLLMAGMVILNIGVVFLMFQLGNGRLDDVIMSYTNLPTQTFTAGRSSVYRYVFEHTSAVTWFLGNGIGYAPGLMSKAYNLSDLVLLHSDILRLFVETGIFFVTGLILKAYSAISGKSLYLVLLLNFFLLTDNYIIYPEVMFLFYVCLIIVEHQERTKSWVEAQ